MKKSLGILFLVLNTLVYAQKFEIPAEGQPFYQAVEWKGLGGMILSRDPSLQQKQIKITLLANEGKSTWQQVMNPIGNETFFLSEDGGKYAYFLENLELNNGKVFIHQVSAAGNIKVMNLSFASEFKRLGGINYNDVKLVDIVTTDKALVWLFTYSEKAKNKITTISVSMTHHNFNLYASIVSENVSSSSKIEDQISWYVAGEKGENIIYAARSHASKDAGWKIKEISPKGVLVNEQNLGSEGLKYATHTRVGFGRRGSALLKRTEPDEKGSLVYSNGNFYVGGVESNGTTSQFVTYQFMSTKKWEETGRTSIDTYNAKKKCEVGFLQLKEGVAWFLGTTKELGIMQIFGNKELVKTDNCLQETYNPSKLLTANFPNTFLVSLTDKWLVFEPKQLPVKGALTFEYFAK